MYEHRTAKKIKQLMSMQDAHEQLYRHVFIKMEWIIVIPNTCKYKHFIDDN